MKRIKPGFLLLIALAFYSIKVEKDHVDFANDAIEFFKDLTKGNGFVFDTTTNMEDLNEEKLKDYSIVLMLNDFPHTAAQREAFMKYMENGGGWLGFHVAGYNDKDTHWPWFVQFLGGAVFYSPRENKDVKVLASLSAENYPFGLKDIIRSGDTPVVWTNTKYRMVYMNMGHANQIFTDATQNRMIVAALRYVVASDKKGNVFKD